MPPRLDYNFKDLDFETQQQLLDLCDQVPESEENFHQKYTQNSC